MKRILLLLLSTIVLFSCSKIEFGEGEDIIPDPTVSNYTGKDFGFEYVDDTTSLSYFTLVKNMKNGDKIDVQRVEVKLRNKTIAPPDQTKTVDDFTTTGLEAILGAKLANGNQIIQDRITIQEYKVLYTARTNQSDEVFQAYTQEAIFKAPDGSKINFLAKDYTFVDKSFILTDLSNAETLESKLITSTIEANFNEHPKNLVGKTILTRGKFVSSYEGQDFTFTYVDENTSVTGFTLVKIMSNGEKIVIDKIESVLKNRVIEPLEQSKTVNDFTTTGLTPMLGIKVANGTPITSNNITVQEYKILYTTRTNQSDEVFEAYTQEAIFTTPDGGKIMMLAKDYSFADKSFALTDLGNTETMESKLVTSTIEANYNEHPKDFIGKTILNKSKSVLDYEGKDFTFTYVDKNTSLTAFILVKIMSNGEKVDVQKVEQLLINRVVEPSDQIKVVSDFTTNSLTAILGTKVSNGNPVIKDNISTQEYKTLYTARTNQSDEVFEAYIQEATFTAPNGKKIKMLAKDYSLSDNGFAVTDLSKEGNYDRKLVSSTIVAQFNERSNSFVGKTILKKLEEADVRTSWRVENITNSSFTLVEIFSQSGEKRTDFSTLMDNSVTPQGKQVFNLTSADVILQNFGTGNSTTTNRRDGNFAITTNTTVYTARYSDNINVTFTGKSESFVYTDGEVVVNGLPFDLAITYKQTNKSAPVDNNLGQEVYTFGSVIGSSLGERIAPFDVLVNKINDKVLPPDWIIDEAKTRAYGGVTVCFAASDNSPYLCASVVCDKGIAINVNNAGWLTYDWTQVIQPTGRIAAAQNGGVWFPTRFSETPDKNSWGYYNMSVSSNISRSITKAHALQKGINKADIKSGSDFIYYKDGAVKIEYDNNGSLVIIIVK